ncbi:uncharacterized protein FTOL_04891 [Fusarium torulosum]|uniref:Uncharacterized protein n=1 Tax=Fusarium torulosum TaxID=33205 RepID=A0AAE8M6N6_9HYPO|nr:uncharacterized protein FTOL_04891 [Fusarium torulosum]
MSASSRGVAVESWMALPHGTHEGHAQKLSMNAS